jgi:hypothetical protein
MPAQAVNFTATFEEGLSNSYSVQSTVVPVKAANAGNTAMVTLDDSSTEISGATPGVGITFSTTNVPDWYFTNWTIATDNKPYGFGSGDYNTSNPLSVAMTSGALVLQANYEQYKHYITVSKNPGTTTGDFTVDPENAATPNSDGQGQVDGTVVTLTAPTSDATKVFADWTLDGLTPTEETTTSSNPIKVTRPANDTATAQANYDAPVISTDPTSLAFTDVEGDAATNSKTFTVTSNVPWTATVTGDFASSHAEGDVGSTEITVWPTAANASGDTDKPGTVKLSGAGIYTATTATTTLAQAHTTPILSYTPAEAQSWAWNSTSAVTINVTSNLTWKATSSTTGFTVTGGQNITGDGSFTIKPNGNNPGAARSATLTVAGTVETATKQTSTMSQASTPLRKVTSVSAAAGITITNGTNAATARDTGVLPGTTVTFTATAATYYTLNSLTVSGATDTNSAVGTLTFVMPSSDVTVSSSSTYTGPSLCGTYAQGAAYCSAQGKRPATYQELVDDDEGRGYSSYWWVYGGSAATVVGMHPNEVWTYPDANVTAYTRCVMCK